MNTDLTFITNEKDSNLLERFKVLIKDTKFFDCLVGHFQQRLERIKLKERFEDGKRE